MISPHSLYCNHTYLKWLEVCRNRDPYVHWYWRMSLVKIRCKNDNTHSKLLVYCWCKVFHGLHSILVPYTSAKKLASSLRESLPYTYRCYILGGSLFSVHSFAMASYFCCVLLLNFLLTWVHAGLYAQRKDADPGRLFESSAANLAIFSNFIAVKMSRYDHFRVLNEDFFDSRLVLAYKCWQMS